MPTKAEWWTTLPAGKRACFWERRYLDHLGRVSPRAEDLVDSVGLLNRRWATNDWRRVDWHPLEFHSYAYFEAHPASRCGELTIDAYLATGLDFYVYLCTDSVYVSYTRIMQGDTFRLVHPATCGFTEVTSLECKIVEPAEPARKCHQVRYGWGRGFAALVLPVFLRLEPDALGRVKRLFEDSQVNTLMFDLVYVYPREEKTTLSADLSEVHVEVVPPDDLLAGASSIVWPGFFTFGRPRKQVRFLVASDIHVADRNDAIESGSFFPAATAEELAEQQAWRASIAGRFCNYNRQAGRLASKALAEWKAGRIDYVVLMGDLVDFVLKDGVDARADIQPTEMFLEAPRPFALGEDAYDLAMAISCDESRPAFAPQENIDRIQEVIETKLARIENTNWDEFRKVFAPMTACVHTFLVPGNHDYLVFGSELAGMTPGEFSDFFGWEGAFGSYMLALTRGNVVAALIVGDLAGGPPDWQDVSTCGDMGLERSEGERYDAHRLLRCGDDNAFRALLGSFWHEASLTGLRLLGGDPGVRADIRADPFSTWLIKLEGGRFLRFGFLNTGPSWNPIINVSPWCRGFRKKDKAAERALQEFESWRKAESSKDDMFALFMHAPILNRPFPTAGIEKRALIAPVLGILPLDGASSEATRIWLPASTAQGMDLTQDPMFGAPFHSHWGLVSTLCPEDVVVLVSGDDELPPPLPTYEKLRVRLCKSPGLVFAGHTHWRHVYELKARVTAPFEFSRWVEFVQGTDLLNTLHEAHDPQWWHPPSNYSAFSEEPGQEVEHAGRSLLVTTGCVGPRPPGELTMGGGGRLEYGDEAEPGYTNPRTRQGYYVTTVDTASGRVSSVDWNSLWYLDEE